MYQQVFNNNIGLFIQVSRKVVAIMESTARMSDARTAKSVSRLRFFIYFAAGMAGLLFGLDQGVISGALPFISQEWNLDSSSQEWVVSSMMVGAAVGALVASYLAKKNWS